MPDRPALFRPIVLLLLLTILAAANAQPYTTGQEVMDAMADRPAPSSTIATMTMTVTAASGHALTREMQIWATDDGPKQLIKFSSPADVRGSGFLVVEQPDGSSESLLYLPALDRVRRVAGGQQQDAFFGSDFSYEDISGLSGDIEGDFEHTLLEVQGGSVYVVEGVAAAGSDSSYDRIVYFVPEAQMLPERVEFYRGGQMVKLMTIGAFSEVGDYLMPSEIRMETVATGSFTTIVQTGFELDTAIPDEVFSERFLRR